MLNKVMIIGNLGRDPELNTVASGLQICNFSVATSKKIKGVEKTEWHNITTFNKTAEICAKYLKKGSKVYVEGELQTDSWEKDGVKRSKTSIIAQSVQFIGGKSDSGGGDDSAPAGGGGNFAQSFNDDEIPF